MKAQTGDVIDYKSRRKRKSYDIPNQAHCLTFSCFQQRPFFSRSRCCQWMLDAIIQARQKQMFDLLAYVIMPEHVHIVLVPKSEILIRNILTTIKQSVSKRAILWVKQNTPAFLKQMEDQQPNGEVHYHFWQRGGGYDRNLRSRDDIAEKIEYIHSNPVRRKLVEKCSDWLWSSYNAWTTGIDEPILIDRYTLF